MRLEPKSGVDVRGVAVLYGEFGVGCLVAAVVELLLLQQRRYAAELLAGEGG